MQPLRWRAQRRGRHERQTRDHGEGLVTGRFVVLLCGPPGAGKTTAALASGLQVYDRDDACWTGERHFVQALTALGHDPDAQAVVIRSGATSSARASAAALIGATHIYLVTLPENELARRIVRRGRPDTRREIAAVGRWYSRSDRADGVQDFPGWEHVDPMRPVTLHHGHSTPGVTRRDW